MRYKYDEFNNNDFESHKIALGLIDEGSKVLDIGCATGYFARELLKKSCETWGVDMDQESIKKAEQYCKKAFLCNINNEEAKLPLPKLFFDKVILLDVIEHLTSPKNVLQLIKPHVKKDGKIVVSVPNISHASIRWMICKGNFDYTNTGIMDETHVHFYTHKTIVDLLKKSGYKILRSFPTNGICKAPLIYKITDRLPTKLQYELVKIFPNLFAYQFVIEAKIK